MPSRPTTRSTAALLNATAAASASVIGARMLAFSDPSTALSAWHRSETLRMSSEKLAAARDGALSATLELSLLPWRMWQLARRPAAWTPAGWLDACTRGAELWLGVGSAALRPATRTAVRNRSRLARKRIP
jgi:hypothetical protein